MIRARLGTFFVAWGVPMLEPRRGVRPFRTRPDMRQTTLLAAIVLVALIAMPGGPAWAGSPLPDLVAKGKYIFAAAGGGCGCHTEPGKAATGLNAGGRRFDAPFGTVYARISLRIARPESAPGRTTKSSRPSDWGAGPMASVSSQSPVMVFNGMAEETSEPWSPTCGPCPESAAEPAEEHHRAPLRGVFLPAWLAAFAARETPPSTAPTSGPARGEYLVRAVGHCGECHTPRGITQAVDNSRSSPATPKDPRFGSRTSPPTRIRASPGPRRRSPTTWKREHPWWRCGWRPDGRDHPGDVRRV